MPKISNITSAEVRMYRMGTGDFFILKFYSEETVKFKMMIDCGCWIREEAGMQVYIEDMKTWTEGSVDLLVITHEHYDHVSGFEAWPELFTNNFSVKQIWMAWTEDDSNPLVADWAKKYGEKKKALAAAVYKINELKDDYDFQSSYDIDANKNALAEAREGFAKKLSELVSLQYQAISKEYKGNLAGMKVVKEQIANGNVRFLEPGEVIQEIEGLTGVRIYILGPPRVWESIKKENGGEGESYKHNKELFKSDAFAAAVSNVDSGEDLAPFDQKYLVPMSNPDWTRYSRMYNDEDSEWRNIEFDWLMSAGNLALRVNSMTNNLSVVMAFEVIHSNKVMLFPGDAEYGSWASWHDIKWDLDLSRLDSTKGKPAKTLAEDLLNRTVFYKVAHHLSHNGTAKRLGLEMMISSDLVAMATLDYAVISKGWKSTMPNGAIVDELLSKTKGRLIVMNEDGLLADRTNGISVKTKVAQARLKLSQLEKEAFAKRYLEDKLFHQYHVDLK